MTDNTPDYKDNLYFNSQNTKNEQQKDLCITSEQLTEQWKKGELPSGEYYIIDDLGLHTTDRYYPSHGFGTELPQSVLGRVPSYEEWQASENYIDYLKQCISVYESKDKQATETSIAYNELLEENTKLKELLKRARNLMNYTKDWACSDATEEMIAKINQALGEE